VTLDTEYESTNSGEKKQPSRKARRQAHLRSSRTVSHRLQPFKMHSRTVAKSSAQWLRQHGGLPAAAATASALVAAVLVASSSSSAEEQQKQQQTEQTRGHNHNYSPKTTINSAVARCEAAATATTPIEKQNHIKSSRLYRKSTLKHLNQQSTKYESLLDKYAVDWDHALGHGAFGAVYKALNKRTRQAVALKEISKALTDNTAFYREMNALMKIREAGGHPNICTLHEHFEEDVSSSPSAKRNGSNSGFYYVVLDLIQGGEMFDHLITNGAFSEMDAARMFREVASALQFLHGLDVVHGDLKPENLMLSSNHSSSAAIKVVDFGSSQTAETPKWEVSGWTTAYCPPEVLDDRRRKPYMEASQDMWSTGVILYIMLTGVHPYDLTGRASDEEIERNILSKKPIPMRNSPITAHLSESAIDLMEKLMDPNSRTRLTAHEMLEHPWIKGETARQDKMAYSDKKLSTYKRVQKILESRAFENFIKWSDDINEHNQHHHGQGDDDDPDSDDDDTADTSDGDRHHPHDHGGKSLIERSFQSFDPQSKGFISPKDLHQLHKDGPHATDDSPNTSQSQRDQTVSELMETPPLSLTGYADLLSESMKNRYFAKDHVIYEQGSKGDSMFFINSGVVQVTTNDGSTTTRGPGNYFGEGALLHQDQMRSATIKCQTPVHVMEISREDFNKYLEASKSSELLISLKEKDKIRKKNRARAALRLHKNLEERDYANGEALFVVDEVDDHLYLIEYGKVDVQVEGKTAFSAKPGNFCGEFTVLSGKARNCTAICVSKQGCITHVMQGSDFRNMVKSSPDIQTSVLDLSYRRDFKKAVVKHLQKEFPYDNPREAFDAVRSMGDSGKDYLDIDTVGNFMRQALDPQYTDDDIREMMTVLDLSNSGTVTFDEFKKVFVANIKTSAAM